MRCQAAGKGLVKGRLKDPSRIHSEYIMRKSRNKVSVGEPAEGSLPFVVCRSFPPSVLCGRGGTGVQHCVLRALSDWMVLSLGLDCPLAKTCPFSVCSKSFTVFGLLLFQM